MELDPASRAASMSRSISIVVSPRPALKKRMVRDRLDMRSTNAIFRAASKS